MIEFTHAQYLPLVLGGALFVLLLYLELTRRRNRFLKLRSRKNTGRIFGTARLILYGLTICLVALLIGMMLLQPHIKTQIEEPIYEPLNIVLCDDMSLSMLAQAGSDPCGPSRLQVAREEEEKFIRMLELKGNDFVGLVAFTRLGYRLIPVLTRDYAHLRRVYASADENFIRYLKPGTNHWDAITEATKIFDPKSPYKRVLVIITDGEPDAPEEVLQETRKEALTRLSKLGDVSIYILGIGDPGTEYPIPKSRDENNCPKEFLVQTEGEGVGKIITTSPNIVELSRLAGELGGIYRHSKTGAELSEMLKDTVERERVRIGTKYKEGYRDLTDYLIFATLVLLTIAVILKSP